MSTLYQQINKASDHQLSQPLKNMRKPNLPVGQSHASWQPPPPPPMMIEYHISGTNFGTARFLPLSAPTCSPAPVGQSQNNIIISVGQNLLY
ncbi:MAG: hypothetical protein GY820_04530 [Gammaproteobacteria bacterium]|nr:hypothetical protein [Gammaproteobacteria bacterium]